MTHDEARTYFFTHLPECVSAKDLTRLTYAVYPHLNKGIEPYLDRPFKVQELFLHIILTYKLENKVDIWYSCNTNITTQLRALEPVFQRGSSAGHFCSGLGVRLKIPNGPSEQASGLPLSPLLKKEYDEAKIKLDQITHIDAWWTTFINHTPLWLRIAYSWDNPTTLQKKYIATALDSIRPYANVLTLATQLEYVQPDNAAGYGSIHYRSPAWPEVGDDFNKDVQEAMKSLHVWNGINAGQNFLNIDAHKINDFSIKGFHRDNMPALYHTLEMQGAVLCSLLNTTRINNYHLKKYSSESKHVQFELPAGDLTPVDSF